MKEELLFLKEQDVDAGLIEAVEEFSGKYPVPEQAAGKTPPPPSMELSQIVRGLELAIQALA